MKRTSRIAKCLAGAAGVLAVGAAAAATTTTTFDVTATVASSCAVSASTLGFGSYNPLAVANLDSTTTISVTCSLLTPYNVGISAGLYGASVSARKMQISGGSDKLDYTLYRDALRTLNWGTTVGTDTVSGTGTGLAIPTTVYGRVTSGQVSAPIGSYSDTVTVTVTY